jgi:hypothetical protein
MMWKKDMDILQRQIAVEKRCTLHPHRNNLLKTQLTICNLDMIRVYKPVGVKIFKPENI